MTDALQQAEDRKNHGDILLRDWGAALRNEPWPGPKDIKGDPMFRDVKCGYRDETRDQEKYNADDVDVVIYLLRALAIDETSLIAIHCYYAEMSSCFNYGQANEYFERKTGERLTNRGFKKILDSVCTQLGASYQMVKSGEVTINKTAHTVGLELSKGLN